MGLFKRLFTEEQEATRLANRLVFEDQITDVDILEEKIYGSNEEKVWIPVLGKIYFRHIRDVRESHGGATLAYQFYLDDDGSPMVRYGFSICSPEDNFSYKQGRVKAEGRLRSTAEKWSHLRGHAYLDNLQVAKQVISSLESRVISHMA